MNKHSGYPLWVSLLAGILVAATRIAAGPPVSSPEEVVGGVGLTHLTVYDQRRAPDGLNSGSPHVHAVTDEGYYVLAGTGRVELHDLERGFRVVELKPGTYLQFPPGTVHRLVNNGGLTILVLMGNAGLPERGDARIYFGRAVDEDPAEYARLAGLAKEKGLAGALDRRDAAVKAYQELLAIWSKDRTAYRAELGRFLDVHRRAMAAEREKLAAGVTSGPVTWGDVGLRRVKALPEALAGGGPVIYIPQGEPGLGMCGLLRPVTALRPVDK